MSTLALLVTKNPEDGSLRLVTSSTNRNASARLIYQQFKWRVDWS